MAVVALLAIVQLVIGVVRLAGGADPQGVAIVVYLIGSALAVPVAAFMSLTERTRWGSATVSRAATCGSAQVLIAARRAVSALSEKIPSIPVAKYALNAPKRVTVGIGIGAAAEARPVGRCSRCAWCTGAGSAPPHARPSPHSVCVPSLPSGVRGMMTDRSGPMPWA
ncbi:hypothetical protein SANTM175S_00564 [Streptomyces antimycoticus]